MFSTANTLPPLSALTSEPRLARRETTPAAPLPSGECRFILLHPSVHNQRCSCQGFHHNSRPGSVCECGHQACYHVRGSREENFPLADPSRGPDRYDETVVALVNRIHRLEQSLEHEKRARADEIGRERRLRDTQVRSLQQALHPFHRKENELREKVVQLEDRLDDGDRERLRLDGRLEAMDDAALALERRLEDVETPDAKRRRLDGRPSARRRMTLSEPRSLDPAGGRVPPGSRRAPRRPRLPSPRPVKLEHPVHAVGRGEGHAPVYPRSSGILDTSKLPGPSPIGSRSPEESRLRPPSPRSSGILQLSRRAPPPPSSTDPTVPAPTALTPALPADRPPAAGGHVGSVEGPLLAEDSGVESYRFGPSLRIPDLDLYHMLQMLGKTRRLRLTAPAPYMNTNGGAGASAIFRLLLAEDDRAASKSSRAPASSILEQLYESTIERATGTEMAVMV